MTKIAVSSMKPPIVYRCAGLKSSRSPALARFPWRSLPKSRLMPAFFHLTGTDLGPPNPGHMILGLTPSAGAFTFTSTQHQSPDHTQVNGAPDVPASPYARATALLVYLTGTNARASTCSRRPPSELTAPSPAVHPNLTTRSTHAHEDHSSRHTLITIKYGLL